MEKQYRLEELEKMIAHSYDILGDALIPDKFRPKQFQDEVLEMRAHIRTMQLHTKDYKS